MSPRIPVWLRVVAAAICFLTGDAYAEGLLHTGDAFPAWQLSDHTGATVSSTSLAGKSYLLWLCPRAMTQGCIVEGAALRDHMEAFQKKHVEVLGVSFDEPKTNAAFVSAQHFPFRMLSDRERTLATSMGLIYPPHDPVARRVSYLIGPDAKVRKVYSEVNPRTHAEEVLRDLDAK